MRPTAFFKSIAGQVRGPTQMLPAPIFAVGFAQSLIHAAPESQSRLDFGMPGTRVSRFAVNKHSPDSQVEIVKGGKPYVMFGDGTLAACKPISEADLASFIADCVQQPERINQILPIGGAQPRYAAGLMP